MIVIASLAVAGVVVAGPMDKRAPRTVKLLDVTHSEYKSVQNGQALGSESVVRRTFDNNTIVYECEAVQAPAPSVRIVTQSEMTLTEDSSFLRKYSTHKTITQEDNTVEQRIDIEMVANVAVTEMLIGQNEARRRVVLPSGTALLEQAVVHHFYPLLFWYDGAVGGRQNFQTFDPSTGHLEMATLFLEAEETISVNGKDVAVTVYKLERERAGEMRVYVDGDGVIVRYQFGLTIWNLVAFSHESPQTN